MFRLLNSKEIEGYEAPVYIENLDHPSLSQWAFCCGRRDVLSAWIVFRLRDGKQVAYNIENYLRKWKLWAFEWPKEENDDRNKD